MDWWNLIERKTVHDYFETLRSNKIGPEGRLTKLERHVDALNFIKLHVEDKHLSKINLFIELISKHVDRV